MRRGLLPLLCLFALSSPLHAQDAQARATARRLAEQAQAAFDSKDYDAAIERFTRAVTLVSAPTLLLALGRAHRERGQLVEAEQRLLEAARFVVKPGDPASWPEAARQAAIEAAAVTPRVPSLSIVLSPAGADAAVTLDGRPVTVAALGAPIAVNPGAHTIVTTGARGSRTDRRDVQEREQARVELDVTALLAVPAPSPSGAPPATTSSEVAPTSAPSLAPRPPKRGSPVAGYAALGAGALFVGLGSFAGVTAKRRTDDIKESCVDGRCPASLRADRDVAARWADVSTAAFVVGAAAVGIGVFVLVRSSKADVALGPRSVEVRGAFLPRVVPLRLAGRVPQRGRPDRALLRRRRRGGRGSGLARRRRGRRQRRRGRRDRGRGGASGPRGRGGDRRSCGLVRRGARAQHLREVRARSVLRRGRRVPRRCQVRRLRLRSQHPGVLGQPGGARAPRLRQPQVRGGLRHRWHLLQPDLQRGLLRRRRLRFQRGWRLHLLSARQRRAGLCQVRLERTLLRARPRVPRVDVHGLLLRRRGLRRGDL